MATPGPGRGVRWDAYGGMAATLGRTGEAIYRGKAALGEGIGGGLAGLGAAIARAKERDRAAAERAGVRAEDRERWEAEFGYRQERAGRADWEWEQEQAGRAERERASKDRVSLEALAGLMDQANQAGDADLYQRASSGYQAVAKRLAGLEQAMATAGVSSAVERPGVTWQDHFAATANDAPGRVVLGGPGGLDMVLGQAEGLGLARQTASAPGGPETPNQRMARIEQETATGFGAAAPEGGDDIFKADTIDAQAAQVKEQANLLLRSKRPDEVARGRGMLRAASVMEAEAAKYRAAGGLAQRQRADEEARARRGMAYAERMAKRTDEMSGDLERLFGGIVNEQRKKEAKSGEEAQKRKDDAEGLRRLAAGIPGADQARVDALAQEVALGRVGQNEALRRLEAEFKADGGKGGDGISNKDFSDISEEFQLPVPGGEDKKYNGPLANYSRFPTDLLEAYLAREPNGPQSAKVRAEVEARRKSAGAVERWERGPDGKLRRAK